MNGLLWIVIILVGSGGDGLGLGMRVRGVGRLGRWSKDYGMRGVGNVYG